MDINRTKVINRLLFFLLILTALGSLALNIGYVVTVGANTQALIEAAGGPDVGYCFVKTLDDEFLTTKLSKKNCLSNYVGSLWCDNVVLANCFAATADAPKPNEFHPITDAPTQSQSGYLNDPFGDWTEPGLCLSAGKRQFDIFSYPDTEDCFTKLEDPQVCDYLGVCFRDQRSLVDYLKGFAQ